MLAKTKQAAQLTHRAMGTVMGHRAYGDYAGDSLAAVQAEIDRLEKLLSRFLPGSDINRVNESAGIQSEQVSPETFEVLLRAQEYARSAPGCFDPTIEPLVTLWSASKASLNSPDEDSIRQALALVNFRDLCLDAWNSTAGLRCPGQGIDLGGIGKGYAADRAIEVLSRYGITSAFSNLGGNVVTLGCKPDGSPWQIGIQHPRNENRILGALAVDGQSVVTSGDYQRYFMDRQGIRRHHILDPRTGYPAGSGLISVTIVSACSLAADALSTIIFVAGLEEGLALLRCIPQTEAVLVDEKLHVFLTAGLKYRFQADQGIEIISLN